MTYKLFKNFNQHFCIPGMIILSAPLTDVRTTSLYHFHWLPHWKRLLVLSVMLLCLQYAKFSFENKWEQDMIKSVPDFALEMYENNL